MHDEADIFRELAPLLRVRPELQALCRFGAQWASGHEPEGRGWAPFHIVTHGACLLDAGDRIGIRLNAGDVAVLPHGGRTRSERSPLPEDPRRSCGFTGVCTTNCW